MNFNTHLQVAFVHISSLHFCFIFRRFVCVSLYLVSLLCHQRKPIFVPIEDRLGVVYERKSKIRRVNRLTLENAYTFIEWYSRSSSLTLVYFTSVWEAMTPIDYFCRVIYILSMIIPFLKHHRLCKQTAWISYDHLFIFVHVNHLIWGTIQTRCFFCISILKMDHIEMMIIRNRHLSDLFTSFVLLIIRLDWRIVVKEKRNYDHCQEAFEFKYNCFKWLYLLSGILLFNISMATTFKTRTHIGQSSTSVSVRTNDMADKHCNSRRLRSG